MRKRNYFSDLEGLGATAHVVIDYIDDHGDSTNMYDFTPLVPDMSILSHNY